MRRLLIAVIVAAVAVGAALLPRPPEPPPPLAGVVIDRPGIDSPLDAAIWYCPWAQSTAARDSVVSLASLGEAAAEFTFPVAIPGEDPDRAEAATGGPGAGTVVLSDIAQRGDSPGFAEFSGGPAAVAVTVVGEVLAADGCVFRGPDEWFFVGGATALGDRLRLRLFNPFPETAKVTVTGFSEIGVEALADLRGISVGPRSWRDIEFAEMLRQRQSLVIAVRVDSGLVIPAMAFARGEDEDWWSGTGLSTVWEFPVVRADPEDETTVVVANPGLSQVMLTVDLFGEDPGVRETRFVPLDPESPVRIGLEEVEFEVVAARVAATGQVVAAVAAVGPSGTAVTAGLPERGTTWLLPGPRFEPDHQADLWLLNSGEEAMVVTVSLLTADGVFNSNEMLQPGVVTRVRVLHPGAIGYLVRGPDPFTAAWTIRGPSGLAYSAGSLVPDE